MEFHFPLGGTLRLRSLSKIHFGSVDFRSLANHLGRLTSWFGGGLCFGQKLLVVEFDLVLK